MPKHSRSKHNALFVRRGGTPRHGKGKPPVPKDGNRMNKTEARYAAHLQAQCEAQAIAAWWYEPISWRVAEASHYKPDFLVQYEDGTLEVHECKATRGREWASTPEAWLKLKVVAEQMPWRVCVVWQTKDGVWHRDYVGDR